MFSIKMTDYLNKIICGDTLKVLRTMPEECVDMIMTSPPYYGLRDYSVEGQIGLEKTLDEYLKKMLAITAELKRVLKKTGTLWWNHGDSYGGSNGTGSEQSNPGKQTAYRPAPTNTRNKKAGGVPVLTTPSKSLFLQAHRLAIRMVDEQGWILRNTIIWHKPNCMPSSVKDRFTVDFEPVFFFTKSKKYWFEPQYEPMISDAERGGGKKIASMGNKYGGQGLKDWKKPIGREKCNFCENGWMNGMPTNKEKNVWLHCAECDGDGYKSYSLGRNKRCVWKIPTKPFLEAHFAVFPEALVETPIKAGCPEFICEKCGVAREKVFEKGDFIQTGGGRKKETTLSDEQKKKAGYHPSIEKGHTNCGCGAPFRSGVVLDPFAGSGTTLLVAKNLGRNFIGIDLNKDYIKLAEKRLAQKNLF